MTYHFQCRCGRVRGLLSRPELALRGLCYCKDCRAYSNHLGTSAKTHDAHGGAEFIATQARHVRLCEGTRHLACLSLSDKGLLRWYAACCTTPIGNTLRNWKVPYVSLVHTCLKPDPAAFERTFPRLQMRVNTGSARQAPPRLAFRTFVSLAGFVPGIVVSGLTGAYKPNPFFKPPGEPLVPVTVLSTQQRDRAYRAA
ncbi:DUF6151 family protein [Piscinibacter gummiphilus]|uniref:Uncharacterized protein n=1 Tax=Piscinibacter gummiphilus TaxID=946333 RepID=A0A1W6LGI9_9BURK|nr:DUF6151 family protein [Piscinibacter gummiphilus]ARN23394.1 hypothetical protein A4W93_27775 [Piscinibacter gummiphilus]ATU68100.1 hypothetical protein CPZ87_27900 [Piscinibacter gummiphilus]GLS97406.1 hypothetical protein GCM10007918_46980 [Piscinibacter gummiphilus]